MKVPKGYDSVSKTFRLPIDLVIEMETVATKNKISLNKLVVACLQFAMNNIEEDCAEVKI